MTYILQEFENALLELVRNRIAEDEWKHLTTPNAILRNIEDDDEYEIKSRIWELLLQGINWNDLFQRIRDMTESESESEEDRQSSDRDSDN
jgi:hypothetical protein